MRSAKVVGSVGLLMVAATSFALAQVRVLGPPPEPKVEWLKSPMVLEVALPVAEVADARGGWTSVATTRELTGYAVNGVRLDSLSFEIDARRDGCQLAIVTQAIVEPGNDKEVVLTFDVLRGDETVWSHSTKEWSLDGDSSESRRWTVSPRVGAERCRQLAEADGLMLQVTYRVANDV